MISEQYTGHNEWNGQQGADHADMHACPRLALPPAIRDPTTGERPQGAADGSDPRQPQPQLAWSHVMDADEERRHPRCQTISGKSMERHRQADAASSWKRSEKLPNFPHAVCPPTPCVPFTQAAPGLLYRKADE